MAFVACSGGELMDFQIKSDYTLQGDQPQAVDKLVEGIRAGNRFQTLLGATGTGKTFTMANVIQRVERPTLFIAHNKTLYSMPKSRVATKRRDLFPAGRHVIIHSGGVSGGEAVRCNYEVPAGGASRGLAHVRWVSTRGSRLH
jgi:hypothetical protein